MANRKIKKRKCVDGDDGSKAFSSDGGRLHHQLQQQRATAHTQLGGGRSFAAAASHVIPFIATKPITVRQQLTAIRGATNSGFSSSLNSTAAAASVQRGLSSNNGSSHGINCSLNGTSGGHGVVSNQINSNNKNNNNRYTRIAMKPQLQPTAMLKLDGSFVSTSLATAAAVDRALINNNYRLNRCYSSSGANNVVDSGTCVTMSPTAASVAFTTMSLSSSNTHVPHSHVKNHPPTHSRSHQNGSKLVTGETLLVNRKDNLTTTVLAASQSHKQLNYSGAYKSVIINTTIANNNIKLEPSQPPHPSTIDSFSMRHSNTSCPIDEYEADKEVALINSATVNTVLNPKSFRALPVLTPSKISHNYSSKKKGKSTRCSPRMAQVLMGIRTPTRKQPRPLSRLCPRSPCCGLKCQTQKQRIKQHRQNLVKVIKSPSNTKSNNNGRSSQSHDVQKKNPCLDALLERQKRLQKIVITLKRKNLPLNNFFNKAIEKARRSKETNLTTDQQQERCYVDVDSKPPIFVGMTCSTPVSQLPPEPNSNRMMESTRKETDNTLLLSGSESQENAVNTIQPAAQLNQSEVEHVMRIKTEVETALQSINTCQQQQQSSLLSPMQSRQYLDATHTSPSSFASASMAVPSVAAPPLPTAQIPTPTVTESFEDLIPEEYQMLDETDILGISLDNISAFGEDSFTDLDFDEETRSSFPEELPSVNCPPPSSFVFDENFGAVVENGRGSFAGVCKEEIDSADFGAESVDANLPLMLSPSTSSDPSFTTNSSAITTSSKSSLGAVPQVASYNQQNMCSLTHSLSNSSVPPTLPYAPNPPCSIYYGQTIASASFERGSSLQKTSWAPSPVLCVVSGSNTNHGIPSLSSPVNSLMSSVDPFANVDGIYSLNDKVPYHDRCQNTVRSCSSYKLIKKEAEPNVVFPCNVSCTTSARMDSPFLLAQSPSEELTSLG